MTETKMLAASEPAETWDFELPPTEDELPYDDGMPMESLRHILQMQMLMSTLSLHWKDRQDVFIGGNMFVYFSLDQTKGRHFRGPDFFVVLDVPRKEHKSWVVWQENKGPDVVVELLSDSTAAVDRGKKKQVYQDELRVPEYFWCDPFGEELAGFVLEDGRYRPIQPDAQGRLISERLGLALVRWDGPYETVSAPWLRWETLSGVLLPTAQEESEAAQRQAQAAQRQAQDAQRQAQDAQRQAQDAQRQAQDAQRQAQDAQRRNAELEALLASYRERLGEAGDAR